MTEQGFAAAYAGPFDLPPLKVPEGTDAAARYAALRDGWRKALAKGIYGAVPGPPDSLTVTRLPLPGDGADRIVIDMTVAGRSFCVDAALWLPGGVTGPVPLICGLDFVGPAGVLMSDRFPIDPDARIYSRPEYGAPQGRMTEVLRGTSATRWPVGMMQAAGYGVLLGCYGSWVPDDPAAWQGHGVFPLLGCGPDAPDIGAISLWAWSILRLLDVAGGLAEVDKSRLVVAGHSRLGKAALWAAANDARISAVFANSSGCAGAAPSGHAVGETLAQMAATFPHWALPGCAKAAVDLDQHHLLATIAPRGVYLGCARQDLWADPLGTYLAVRAASAFWPDTAKWPGVQDIWDGRPGPRSGRIGYHMRPGGHDLLPYDWRRFLEFLGWQGGTRTRPWPRA